VVSIWSFQFTATRGKVTDEFHFQSAKFPEFALNPSREVRTRKSHLRQATCPGLSRTILLKWKVMHVGDSPGSLGDITIVSVNDFEWDHKVSQSMTVGPRANARTGRALTSSAVCVPDLYEGAKQNCSFTQE
jgi:hypothetical protein